MKHVLILAVIMLSACASNPDIKVVTQTIEIPIAIKCSTPAPTRPVFNVNNLKETDSTFNKVKALVADINLHIGYEIELSAALESCK